jgi:hypothetical protein
MFRLISHSGGMKLTPRNLWMFSAIVRDVSAALDMTKRIFAIAMFIAFVNGVANAQVSPSPTASVSSTPARSVRLSFLPPPMEGTISVGIYDDADQLVRVLHQEAEVDEFSIGADALVTKWDGKDDDGYDLPAGKYSARGFLVALMKVEEIGRTESIVFVDPPDFVRVKLVANPLENNERPIVDLNAGCDDENAYIRTKDGLPLVTVTNTGEILGTDAALMQDPDKSLHVFVRTGKTTREFRVTGITKMMAFDCGEFELK